MKLAYQNYFLMLSEDITNLLSPCFSDAEIDELYWNLVENMALKEGLFPIYDTTLAGNHQIIDLPKYIHKFGIIKGWWAMAGERCLSTIKHFIPDGGRLNEKITFNKYICWEEQRTILAYENNHIYSSNSGEIFHRLNLNDLQKNVIKDLDDFDKYLIIKNDQNVEKINFCDYGFTMKKNIIKFNIYKNYYKDFFNDELFINNKLNNYNNNNNNYNNNNHHHSIFNLYEINELLISLKDECVRICGSSEMKIDPLRESSLCRLYKCYTTDKNKQTNNKKEYVTFYVWIYTVHNNDKNYKIHEDAYQFLEIYYDFVTIEEILNLHRSLMNNLFSEAVIYGILFKSRGIKYKENELAINTSINNSNDLTNCNPLNDLSKHWNSNKSISSWFKCRVSNETNFLKHKDYYGQFNFFFKIPEFKFDPFISGLHYSSVVLRKYVTDYSINNSLDTVKVFDKSSFYPNVYFIHNVNIYSTVYLISALNLHNEPINNKDNLDMKENELKQLNMIALYPSRLKVQIKQVDIFKDTDIKKLFFKTNIV